MQLHFIASWKFVILVNRDERPLCILNSLPICGFSGQTCDLEQSHRYFFQSFIYLFICYFIIFSIDYVLTLMGFSRLSR